MPMPFPTKIFIRCDGKDYPRRRLQRKHDQPQRRNRSFNHGQLWESHRSQPPMESMWEPSIAHLPGCASAWWQKTSINRPSMLRAEENETEPQVRGGVAVNPYSSLTLRPMWMSTSNQDTCSRRQEPGLESGSSNRLSCLSSSRSGSGPSRICRMPGHHLPLQQGSGSAYIAFRLDVGGGYDFRRRGRTGLGSVSMTF